MVKTIGKKEVEKAKAGAKEGPRPAKLLQRERQQGISGADELVPSRYALRVGEIDVLVVSDGVRPIAAPTLATNADPGAGGDPRWWPLTCRSRPSAMWQSPATSFVAYRPSGSTDRLLG